MNGTPPPLNESPALSPESKPNTSSTRTALAFGLSGCLVLFLLNAVVGLADGALGLFFQAHWLFGADLLVTLLLLPVLLVTYFSMAFTPMIPKRFFLPIIFFIPLAQLALLPALIYAAERLEIIAWLFSVLQLAIGLLVIVWIRGGLKLGWPIIDVNQLNGKSFTWKNLIAFGLMNFLVLLPLVVIYFAVCTSLAVGHATEGFMALRPSGLSVQVRKYVRADGKTIQLFPMAHVGDASFYQKLSHAFPSNSIICMEGVTDEKHLLTNHISYARMAKSLGLTEQKEEFDPVQGEVVMADVDVSQFSKDTLAVLNIVMLIHAKGLDADSIKMLLQSSTSPQLEQELLDDLIHKRNRHLLGEIQKHLLETEHIIVPWGAAHIPEIAREIQKSGFHAIESADYTIIHFGSDKKVNASSSKPAATHP